jgi:membrane protein implicated in regulation of membrane protease activity
MLVGFVLYGVATLRAGVLPRWYGLALALSMPVSLPLGVYGTTLFGLILAVLGYALWSRREATTEHPARVR